MLRLMSCALLLCACVRNPATGKLELDFLSKGQEIQMGKDAKKQIEEQMGLQTHPDPGNRLQATEERLRTELKGDTSKLKVGRDEYLQKIDGMTFGEDPRQGYFKGDTFYHPELK